MSSVPLYIHIPYCTAKCDYCDFFSVPLADCGRIPDEYIAAVANEIAAVAQWRGVDAWQTVYVGGGTPSLMTAEQIERLFDAIWASAGGMTAEEVTVELNPRDVTRELLDALLLRGITRISCGFQSFTQDVLSGVHRSSSAQNAIDAMKLLGKQWRGVFSCDFIAGLPGETDDGLIGALAQVAEHGAQHISLYTLTIEENTPLGRRIASGVYDAEAADNQYLAGMEALLSLGYEQYEVSAFCQHGARCKHNEAYWQMSDYIGVGAGAVSSYYGKTSGARYTNTKDIASYVSYWTGRGASAPLVYETLLGSNLRGAEVLDKQTEQFEFFMLGLRTLDGIAEEAYKERFGENIAESTLALFKQWEKRGLCRAYIQGGKHYHAMTQAGILLLDRFLQEIL